MAGKAAASLSSLLRGTAQATALGQQAVIGTGLVGAIASQFSSQEEEKQAPINQEQVARFGGRVGNMGQEPLQRQPVSAGLFTPSQPVSPDTGDIEMGSPSGVMSQIQAMRQQMATATQQAISQRGRVARTSNLRGPGGERARQAIQERHVTAVMESMGLSEENRGFAQNVLGNVQRGQLQIQEDALRMVDVQQRMSEDRQQRDALRAQRIERARQEVQRAVAIEDPGNLANDQTAIDLLAMTQVIMLGQAQPEDVQQFGAILSQYVEQHMIESVVAERLSDQATAQVTGSQMRQTIQVLQNIQAERNEDVSLNIEEEFKEGEEESKEGEELIPPSEYFTINIPEEDLEMQPLIAPEGVQEQIEEVKQAPRQSFSRRVVEAIRRFPDAPRRVIMNEVQLLRLAAQPNRRASIEEVRSAITLGIVQIDPRYRQILPINPSNIQFALDVLGLIAYATLRPQIHQLSLLIRGTRWAGGWISYLRYPIGIVISTLIYLNHIRGESELTKGKTDIRQAQDQNELARKFEVAAKKLTDQQARKEKAYLMRLKHKKLAESHPQCRRRFYTNPDGTLSTIVECITDFDGNGDNKRYYQDA